MSLTLAIAQSGFPSHGHATDQIREFARQARLAGADLLAFPEDVMYPKPLDAAGLRELAEPLDGPFASALASCAREQGLWIAFTMAETHPSGEAPYNTAVVVDDEGIQRGIYRKCHLYDAHGVRESDRLSRGNALCDPIETPFCTMGLCICYDLRFPELARSLALRGCTLLLYPAFWHDGPHKTAHWETLLRARAIENECYVAGICHSAPNAVGRSLVIDPVGEVVAASDGPGEQLVLAELDMDAVAEARRAMPLFSHRRPELYEL